MKSFCLYLLLLFNCFISAQAQPPAPTNESLLKILTEKDVNAKDKKLINFATAFLLSFPIERLQGAKAELDNLFKKDNVPNRDILSCFIESIYQDRLSHANESTKAMINAINAAEKRDTYLSCTFLNYLAYRQTEAGNVVDAVSSYRLARKEAIKLNDAGLQMIADINLSDVFYKNDFYSQSLFYLNRAGAICNLFSPANDHVKMIICYNKAENFFRMKNTDSLKACITRLMKLKEQSPKSYTYRKRTSYYLYLLQQKYSAAINLINSLKQDSLYKFDLHDEQNLADAYFKNVQPDSAKHIINQLLADPSQLNHPEIRYHLYKMLAEIAVKDNDFKTASANFALALKQTEENISRLTQVDNITSLIKGDELEGFYNQKNEEFKRERLWLIFAIIFAVLIILVVAMFYRTIKQKRHYERLLFASKKEELAFINSHDVRKHLTNILGLIEVIKNGKSKKDEYLQAEGHLFASANELDKAIRNISAKLDE